MQINLLSPRRQLVVCQRRARPPSGWSAREAAGRAELRAAERTAGRVRACSSREKWARASDGELERATRAPEPMSADGRRLGRSAAPRERREFKFGPQNGDLGALFCLRVAIFNKISCLVGLREQTLRAN